MKTPSSGFLIVKTFETMYREFKKPAQEYQVIYSIPRVGVLPEQMPKRYRGISRHVISAWDVKTDGIPPKYPFPLDPVIASEPEACQATFALQERGLVTDDFFSTIADTMTVFTLLRHQSSWEILWAADTDSGIVYPGAAELLGYEPTYFTSDHFSAISDCMCFPQWHGTDKEGVLFMPFHERLNAHALFATIPDAEEFLRFYLSHDWTETGDYTIAEVRLIPRPDLPAVTD